VLHWFGHSKQSPPLAGSERCAVVKMALFQAFDDRPSLSQMSAEVRVRAADLEAILENLGID
jgi:hypothetical protein